MSIDVKYRAVATATGGRDGRTRTEDGKLDLQLSIPNEIGGPGGDGVNPEQLFAAGYAACFLSSVKGAGQKLKVRVSPESTVKAKVIEAHSVVPIRRLGVVDAVDTKRPFPVAELT